MRQTDLVDTERGIGLDAVIPRGMRLMYVPIPSVGYHEIVPGAYVDLLAHDPNGETYVVAQGLFVVASVPATDLEPVQLGLIADMDTCIATLNALHTPELELTPLLRAVDDDGPANYGPIQPFPVEDG